MKISNKDIWTGWDIIECIVPWIFVCIVAAIFNKISISSNNDSTTYDSSNLLIYMGIIWAVVSSCIVLLHLFCKKRNIIANSKYSILSLFPMGGFLILFTGLLLFCYRILCEEELLLSAPLAGLRNIISNKPLYFLLLLLLYFLFLVFQISFHINSFKVEVAWKGVIFLFFIIIGVCIGYKPAMNLNAIHFHAYITPIINTFEGRPYDEYFLSTYGHYSLLYYPLVALFGSDYYSIIKSIDMIFVLIVITSLMIINLLVNHHGIFFSGAIAIMGLFTIVDRGGAYLQGSPHRVFLAPIAIFVIVCHQRFKHNEGIYKGMFIVELLICIFSIIWNLETAFGVICGCEIFYILTFVKERRDDSLSSEYNFKKDHGSWIMGGV